MLSSITRRVDCTIYTSMSMGGPVSQWVISETRHYLESIQTNWVWINFRKEYCGNTAAVLTEVTALLMILVFTGSQWYISMWARLRWNTRFGDRRGAETSYWGLIHSPTNYLQSVRLAESQIQMLFMPTHSILITWQNHIAQWVYVD